MLKKYIVLKNQVLLYNTSPYLKSFILLTVCCTFLYSFFMPETEGTEFCLGTTAIALQQLFKRNMD